MLAAALFRRRSARDSAGTVALASVGLAARSSIFMENRGPGVPCAARVYLNREMRPLWSANSGRSVSQPPTGGTRAPRREAPCAHALSWRAPRLSLSLLLSLPLYTRVPRFPSLVPLFTPPWSNTTVVAYIQPSLFLFSLSPSRFLALFLLFHLARLPCPPCTFSHEQRESPLFSPDGFYRCRRCRFSLARSAMLHSLDSVAKDRGLQSAVTSTSCFFLRQQREGVRSITFDRPYSTIRHPYSLTSRTSENKLDGSTEANGTLRKWTINIGRGWLTFRTFLPALV